MQYRSPLHLPLLIHLVFSVVQKCSHIISYDCCSIFVFFRDSPFVMPRPQIESACKNSLLVADGWSLFFIVCSCNKQSMRKHVQHKSSRMLPHQHQYSVWGVLFSTLRVNTNRPVHRMEILSAQSIPKRCASVCTRLVHALEARILMFQQSDGLICLHCGFLSR